MFDLVAFEKAHTTKLLEHPQNVALKDLDYGQLEGATAFTLMRNGIPALCGGWVEYWPGRAYGWLLFDCELRGFEQFAVMRILMRTVKLIPVTRIELAVPLGLGFSGAAQRRAGILGFTCETDFARKFFPGGRPAALFSLVKGS